MADGASFDIAVEAEGLGVSTTTEQLNAFVEKIQATNAVATKFDAVVAAASARLTEASAAAKLAADALAVGETKYKELESAANRAAKEVERASVAGKDTTALQAAASAAAAKMREQAAAVDELRAKSDAASASENKLAASLKALKGEQASAAADIKKGIAAESKNAGDSAKKAAEDTKKAAENQKQSAEETKAGMLEAAGAAEIAAAAIAAVVFGVVALSLKAQPAMMNRFNASLARAQKGILGLFSGLKLDKLMTGLDGISAFFDKNTSTANGLKKLIEIIFQPIIDGAAKAAPYVKEAFKGMEWAVLEVVLGVLLLRNKIVGAIPPEVRAHVKDLSDKIFTLKNAFYVGAIVVGVLLIAVLALAEGMVIVSIPILLIVGVIALVIAAILNWKAIVKKISDVWDDFVDSASTAASDMIDGLVTGIENGAAKIYAAMKKLAKGAIDKFEDMLGISSPSKVFALSGRFTTEGFVKGIEQGTPGVESAVTSMVTVPKAAALQGMAQSAITADGAPSSPMASPLESMGSGPEGSTSSSSGASASAPSTSSSSSRSITIQSLTVGSAPVSQENWQKLRQMFLEVLEGASITIGGGEAPAT